VVAQALTTFAKLVGKSRQEALDLNIDPRVTRIHVPIHAELLPVDGDGKGNGHSENRPENGNGNGHGHYKNGNGHAVKRRARAAATGVLGNRRGT
jgi:hypothetical protein